MTPPLPSWPPRAFPQEPVHGWFQRLTQLNGQISTRTLAIYCGVNGRNPDPAELLEFSNRFPCRDRENLVTATPQFEGPHVRLFGQLFDRQLHFSLRYPRICPACVRENRYYRAWWDLQVLDACPFHAERLVGRGRLAWWHPVVGVTPEGIDLAMAEPSAADLDTSWEAYVLGRMGLAPAAESTELNCLPVREIAEVAVVLGRLSAGLGKRVGSNSQADRAAYAPTGYSALKAGPDTTVLFFERLLRTSSTSPGKWTRSLGNTVTALMAMPDNGLAGATLRAIDEARQASGIYFRNSKVGAAPLPSGHHTVKAAAALLALRPKQVRDLAIRLGMAAPISSHAQCYDLSDQQVDCIRGTLDRSIDISEAAAVVGLAAEHFQILADDGLVRPLIRTGGASWHGDRFVPEEVSDALAGWRATAQRVTGKGITFAEFCSTSRLSAGEVAVQIAKGTREIVAWDRDKIGFAGCQLWPERLGPPIATKRARRWNGVSLSEAAAAIGVPPSKLALLVRAGLVKQLPRTSESMSGICAESLGEFRRSFAAARTYSDILGIPPPKIRARLRAAGAPLIQPEMLPGLSIYSQADVVARLGRQWNVRTHDDSESSRLWNALREHLKAAGSANRLVGGVGQSAAIRSGTGRTTMSIAIRPCHGTVTLSFLADRASMPARYDRVFERFSTLTAAWPEAEFELDEAMGKLAFIEQFSYSNGLPHPEAAAIARAIDARATAVRFHLRPTK